MKCTSARSTIRLGFGRPGKFADAITKLDHLTELGVNAVELMPSFGIRGDKAGVTTRRYSTASKTPATAAGRNEELCQSAHHAASRAA